MKNSLDKIYIAGHNGMVGSAIERAIKKKFPKIKIIKASRSNLDLTNQKKVDEFFKKNKPDIVIVAAAKVGGIYANSCYPANFIYENLMIESNIINCSHHHQIKRLLFLGSSCIYPPNAKQPFKEDSLLSGLLEPTNEPYAIAKIAGIKLCESFNRQYKTDFRSVMPTNLYGFNDNYDEKNSHVIPALIKRIHLAKESRKKEVVIWGSGKPLREFLHVDDLADACLHILLISKKKYNSVVEPMCSHINIGTGEEISIKDLAYLIKKIIGFKGSIRFDKSKPDGAKKKLMSNRKINTLGWKHNISLDAGLSAVYKSIKKDNNF